MAKLETLFCAMTWGLMNALLIAVAFDSAAPVNQSRTAPIVAQGATSGTANA